MHYGITSFRKPFHSLIKEIIKIIIENLFPHHSSSDHKTKYPRKNLTCLQDTSSVLQPFRKKELGTNSYSMGSRLGPS